MSSEHHHEPITAETAAGKYSQTVIDHATNPRNVGSLPNPDGFTQYTGPCGDTVELWLKVKGDKIIQASFVTDGCGPAIACASMVTELAKGKSIVEAQQIGQEEVLKALDGLPEDHRHCALLASKTLKAALMDYLSVKKEPWKKSYRRT